MAQILYPPYIEGKLPAQCGEKLRIPFQFNRATGADDVGDKSLLARIKGVNTNNIIIDELYSDEQYNNIAVFLLPENKLEIGQYYKIQFAWEGSSYYSTVGVFKYTSVPTLTIKEDTIFPYLQCTYKTYDITEKPIEFLYAYGLLSKDKPPKLIGSQASKNYVITGNNAIKEDDNGKFYTIDFLVDISHLPLDIAINRGIQVRTITLNNLECSSQVVSLQLNYAYEDDRPSFNFSFDSNRQYRLLHFINNSAGDFTSLTVRRRVSVVNSNGYEVLYCGNIDNIPNTEIIIPDVVESGETYLYELIAGDLPIASDYGQTRYYKIVPQEDENIMPLYFDDMYLSDKDNNYCIQFNPKVSSLKTNILEQRQNTLGGKYPVFIRNGQTDYTEFSISGLISYLMNRPEETESQRMETSSIHKESMQSATNLTGENIYKERVFRTELIKWLNNGQPKLFRSPTEGNFIVRITNVSLTPNDTLGRMLYTFNCTAVEVAECNYENLRKYNLVE